MSTTNKQQLFCEDVAATANPNASFSTLFLPILMEFVTALKDCLLARIRNPSAVPATADETAEPLALAANSDWIDKSKAVKQRLDSVKSQRRIHVQEFGGYRPAAVRRGIATLRRTAETHNSHMSLLEMKQHVIATFDKADGMTVEDLADVLQSEADEQPPTA
jgi:hypothetical protein